jgi:ferric-dicitrate binding protein FerR (iron transport regulator)
MKSEAFGREHHLAPTTLEEEASDAFVRRLNGDWTADDQLALESRLQRDPSYGDAFRRVEESWGLLDELAETPVGLKYREEAASVTRQISAMRQPNARPSAGQPLIF